jgi:hypothetical protein
MQKLLKIILVILIFVIVSETGYYVYIQSYAGKNLIANGEKTAVTPPISPVPTQNSGCDRILDPIDASISGRLIEAATVSLNRAKPNPNQKLTLIFEQSGFVKMTYDQTDNNRPYIMMVNDKGEKIFTLGSSYYTNLFKINGADKTPITLADVKDGDKILVTEYKGIYNTSNRLEVFIYEK